MRSKVVLFGLGLMMSGWMSGCRNDPIVIYRDVVLADDATVRDDLSVGGSANISGVIIDDEGNVTLPPGSTLTVDHINTDHIEADSAEIDGVTIEDGNVIAPNDIIAEDDLVAGDNVEYVGDLVEVPVIPPPDDDDDVVEPAPLMSSLQSVSGKDHFKVGEDVKMVFAFSGGTPPYDSRCLIVDGTFATEEDSVDGSFTFKEQQSFKVINMPGAGVITCRVTSADGQQVSSSFTIYVGVE